MNHNHIEEIYNQALSDISSKIITTSKDVSLDIRYENLFELYTVIREHGNTAIHGALCEVLVRLLETSILRDPKLFVLFKRWNALVGDASKIIGDRLFEISGIHPPKEFVEYVTKIIGGSASQSGRKNIDYSLYLQALFDKISRSHPRKELRCAICGYHFLKADMGKKRQNVAEAFGLKFAGNFDHRRYNDEWKPIFYETKSRKISLTQLTIDHIVPEEALGWSNDDNLEILCKYCNNGKMAFRWPLEPISVFGAGGLSDFPRKRSVNKIIQIIIVSTIRFSNGICVRCGASSSDAELTVRTKQSKHKNSTQSLTPWNLETICYNCY